MGQSNTGIPLVLGRVLLALLPKQLPANAPGTAAEDGGSAGAPVPPGRPDGSPGLASDTVAVAE